MLPVFFFWGGGGGGIFSHVTVGACGGPRGCFAVLIHDNHEVTPHVVDNVEIMSLLFFTNHNMTLMTISLNFPRALSDFREFFEAFLGSVNRSTRAPKEFCPATQRVFQEQIDHLLRSDGSGGVGNKGLKFQGFERQSLHPGKLTWNLKMMVFS